MTPKSFARHAAQSLSDPGVAAYASGLVTDKLISRKPDLIALRPMLASTAESVVSSKAFRMIVEHVAAHAHNAAFSQGAQKVLLSLPDLQVLVQDAISNANPAMAGRIPKDLETTVAKLGDSKAAEIALQLVRAGKWLRWLWPFVLAAGLALLILAFWLAPDRQRTMVRAGIGLMAAGLTLVGIVAANSFASIWIRDPMQLGLVRELWRTYLAELASWGFLFAGLGVLLAAGGSSLLERVPLRKSRLKQAPCFMAFAKRLFMRCFNIAPS